MLDDIHNFCQNHSKNRRISRELNNVTLAELPSNLIRQTLVLTCSLRVESLHTLFAVCGSTSISTGTSKKTNSIYKEWDVLERRCNDQYEN